VTAPMGVPSATLESCPCVRGSDYAALRSPWIFATVVVIELAQLICAERLDERSHGSHALLWRQRRLGAAHIGPGPSRVDQNTSDAAQRRVYKVIEVVGTSSKSWEAAAAAAVERASQSLRDLRVAEVTEQDVQIKDGKIELYRTKLKLSFKYEGSSRLVSCHRSRAPTGAMPPELKPPAFRWSPAPGQSVTCRVSPKHSATQLSPVQLGPPEHVARSPIEGMVSDAWQGDSTSHGGSRI
jgi:dodecin